MSRSLEAPAYRRITAKWTEAIESGDLEDGYQLPTRPELEKQWGVSRQVVRDALTLLHHSGYLRSEPSKGTFVHRLPRLRLPMDSLEADEPGDTFVAVVEEQGYSVKQKIEIITLYPDAIIAKALDLAKGQRALVRRRMRYVTKEKLGLNSVPYAIADSYYPEHLVRGTRVADPEDITTGVRHVLADIGHRMVAHEDTIIVRGLTTNEASALSVAPGLSAINHTRLSRTVNNTPIRALVSVLPSDRWTLTYRTTGDVEATTRVQIITEGSCELS